ncbi:Retrovirus-related Pol polyprotein from transposon TNT 1-94 [Mycena chlorophos]|uniref:Retrovirus-related Pol polyprotein from transposon TNT 1-94 n=1 Tax=Mycena chlorophos TaxID=658473 RepID=A0A8H6RVN4_MYCCL|nr:Retrovirus-related Pol polyprotein from transposon TNT 1-94 [Mycena chlorophos]
MSTHTTTIDVLPTSVPTLDADGANWAIFALRFTAAVASKGLWGHFDGTSTLPPLSAPPTQPEREAQAKWRIQAASALQLLIQRIPDSALMTNIDASKSVKENWDAVKAAFTTKGQYATTQLRSDFLRTKIAFSAHVANELRALSVRKNELVSKGVAISDEDYVSTIISATPKYLSDWMSSQLSALTISASLAGSAAPSVKPDMLIQALSTKYLRLLNSGQLPKGAKPASTSANNEALAVSDKPGSGKGKGKAGKGKGKGKGPTCWTCGNTGHISRNCPDKKKGGNGGGAAAVDWDQDGAWAADFESSDDDSGLEMPALVGLSDDESDDEMPALRSVGSSDWDSDSEDEDGASICSEGFLEALGAALCETEELSGTEGVMPFGVDLDSGDDWSSEQSETSSVHEEAAAAHEGEQVKLRSELFDSGSTRHLTPYRDELTNYVSIPPRNLSAANKSGFSPIGQGDMEIDVPNGVDACGKLHLTEVLYAPEVGYTLVSIGQLDKLGVATTFANGTCTLQGPGGDTIGKVPRNARAVSRCSGIRVRQHRPTRRSP